MISPSLPWRPLPLPRASRDHHHSDPPAIALTGHDDDPYGGFTHYTLAVSGERDMTDHEVRQESAKRQREHKFQDYVRKVPG